ncbi:MAG: SsrA-binding protein SmpB [Acidimicrobiales bacterium]|jgi:SsrA-binding protein|nr:SsrA-binding protein SmpB [Acidimicrobiales bacterium]
MTPPGTKLIASNRQARHDYEILETVEAGLVLRGSEVKALREAKAQVKEAYARIEGGEAWLLGMHISPWRTAAGFGSHDPDRRRKLLLHRDEIDRLRARVDQERLVLVPLALYFKDGRVKVDLALARPRRKGDRRDAIAKRDADLEARKAMGRQAKRGWD